MLRYEYTQAMKQQFVHLHTHSQYSILDASASLPALVKTAADYAMPALALTDHGNLFGTIDFYKQCKSSTILPIIGCELFLAPYSRIEKRKISGKPNAFHITVLAKNLDGYRNLCKLTSLGYTEGFYYTPRIDFELLANHSAGLICLSGCSQSPFAWEVLNGSKESVVALLQQYQALFKENFYIELQRHTSTNEALQLEGFFEESWLYQQYQEYTQKQEQINATLYELGRSLGIRPVATNNVHYIEREDWRAHEILLNIQSGEPCETWQRDAQGNPTFRTANPKRTTFATHECFFKSAEEMYALFSNIPEALQTTIEIAEQCTLELDFSTKHYPVFIPDELRGKLYTPEERTTAVNAFLQKLCEEGIPKRYTQEHLERVAKKYPDTDPMKLVRERLDYEMAIISSKGMCDYLLIVWDFIHWAKNQGIPMGPGRGSGVGSIILYLIGITDIEPLQLHLFFERFINPERPSYPDIDVDICMDRRSEVINYTIQKYGKDNVAQIITFGSMKAKMVVKDVGRVLNIPLSKVNAIAKLIPEDLNITLEKALEKDPELKAVYNSDKEVQRIIDIGKKLEGSIRNTGIHAAGLIVSGSPLTDNIPVCIAKDSDMLITQYSMKPVEMVGMLKIDFLGLKTLTSIKICVDVIQEQRGKVIDWINLPLNDTATFSLLNKGKTQGIFQLESGGMQELSKNLHLDKFEEIIAVLSLYRPGPMDMIPSFINRKHGVEPIEYDHPWLEPILAETYGIMVYQEQVMQIASRLANYSLGEGDVLRRAMGKKDMKEMVKQREKFLQGAAHNDIDTACATAIFDKMEKFAEYGFNKSHAAAYGYLTYTTAYLKANYPYEWMAALMTCDRDDITKVAKFFHEARQLQIPILPPDVNESELAFAATASGIRFALSAIKGVGLGVAEAIIAERKKNGPFKNLYQFLQRMSSKRIGKKAIELLIDADSFGWTGWSRDATKKSLEMLYDTVLKEEREKAAGILSLFESIDRDMEPPVITTPRSKEELLFKEKELLGFFLTGHPLDAYKETQLRFGTLTLAKAATMPPGTVFRASFVIEEVQYRIASKSQKKFAILSISDSDETYELPIWPEMYEEKQQWLAENRLILAVLVKEAAGNFSCKWLCDLKQVDDARIAESDRFYDKARQYSAKGPYIPKRTQQPMNKQPEKRVEMIVTVDLDRLQASHILALESIFSGNPGDHPVTIHFASQGEPIARLAVAMSLKVAADGNLQQQLNEVVSVISCSLCVG